MIPRADLTLANYPLSEPFNVTLRLRKGEGSTDFSVVTRTYSNWETACAAAAAALPRLLGPGTEAQWAPTIEAYRTGKHKPVNMPHFYFAAGNFYLFAYPTAYDAAKAAEDAARKAEAASKIV